MATGGKRIVFTGGSGKAGRHVIPELIKRGHKVDFKLPSAYRLQY
jgi:nucleoside-diphosphate-sugar epimerase